MFWEEKSVCHLATMLMIIVSLLVISGNAEADFVFGQPENLGPTVNRPNHDGVWSISSDGLILYFESNRVGGHGDFDIWKTTRPTVSDPWDSPRNPGPPLNTKYWDGLASISADNLSLHFSSDRPGGYGEYDIWVSTRDTPDDSWGTPVNLGPTVNSAGTEWSQCTSADGLELYITSTRPGGFGGSDLWLTTRTTKEGEWSTLINLGSTINSSANEIFPSLSPDGLLLFTTSERSGGYGTRDIWVSQRATTSDPWGQSVNLGPSFNMSDWDQGGILSSDGSTLYFSTTAGGYGGLDMWQASINPVVDFTGDYRVDIEDLILLIEHWGQNEPAFDMGPMPWGDGIIDVADLEVFMTYWGQAFHDPNFVAHWKLDETDGIVAYDSVSENDAFVIGQDLWQPEDGQVGGALQFDGLTNHVITPFALDPGEGVLSVFAWVQGGAPGQVMMSQEGGADWLLADSQGFLMTDLKKGGRTAGVPLISETIVTDNTWHHIGLTWDGTNRVLYVDDVEVARDTLGGLKSANGVLYIGTGKGLDAGTFWSGMIDDVRIYDRVVVP
jgi:hypothetical protein